MLLYIRWGQWSVANVRPKIERQRERIVISQLYYIGPKSKGEAKLQRFLRLSNSNTKSVGLLVSCRSRHASKPTSFEGLSSRPSDVYICAPAPGNLPQPFARFAGTHTLEETPIESSMAMFHFYSVEGDNCFFSRGKRPAAAAGA